MNTLAKRIAGLVFVVGIMPLCAMEIVTESNTRDNSDKFEYDKARQGLPFKIPKIADKMKVNTNGHDGFDQLDDRMNDQSLKWALGPGKAKEFIKFIKTQK